LVKNHRRKHATAAQLYVDALRELGARRGKGLEFDKSLFIILQAAEDGRFLSYKQLADASGPGLEPSSFCDETSIFGIWLSTAT
jgi:hypothetical protein